MTPLRPDQGPLPVPVRDAPPVEPPSPGAADAEHHAAQREAAEPPKSAAATAAWVWRAGWVLSFPWPSIQILTVEPAFVPVVTSVMPLRLEPSEFVHRALADAGTS